MDLTLETTVADVPYLGNAPSQQVVAFIDLAGAGSSTFQIVITTPVPDVATIADDGLMGKAAVSQYDTYLIIDLSGFTAGEYIVSFADQAIYTYNGYEAVDKILDAIDSLSTWGCIVPGSTAKYIGDTNINSVILTYAQAFF
jgi:hypothetical protein